MKISILSRGNNILLQEAFDQGLCQSILLHSPPEAIEPPEVLEGVPIYITSKGAIFVSFMYYKETEILTHSKFYVDFQDIKSFANLYSYEEDMGKKIDNYISLKAQADNIDLSNVKHGERIRHVFHYQKSDKVKDITLTIKDEELDELKNIQALQM